MRTDGSFDFLTQNTDDTRDIRFVIDITFNASNKLRLTSHSDITGTAGAGITVINDAISNVSATSQKLNVAEARSEIGAINFELADISGSVSSNLKTQWDGGRGIRQKTTQLYMGFAGQDFSAMRLEQTQIVDKSVTADGVGYKVQCSDIQRTARKDIFAPIKTKLAASFSSTDTVMSVYDTSEFHMNPQGPSYSIEGGTLAAPNMRGYLKIKYNDGWEIVSYTGKTATTFTGISSVRRGLFGTVAVNHTIEGTPSDDNGIDVEEYVYLELPAPKLLYAILTGKLYGYPSSTYNPGDGVLRAKNILPDHWHLAIADSFINLATGGNYWATSFLNQPRALWDKTNDAGYILRFEGAQKTDGKAFYEKEICLPTATFTLINSSGQIGLKTIHAVMSNTAHSVVLNADNVTDADEIVYDLSAVHNTFDIAWGYQEYPEKKDYFRRNILVDEGSIAKHGEGTKLELKFKGVHANKNTIDSIIHMFDALRERHAAPPIKLKCELLPTMGNIEVGDIARVTLPHLIDHTTGLGLDRAMEVQSVSIDQDSGKLSVELFGSTELADTLDSDELNVGTRLTNTWYTSAGSAMPNVSAGVLTTNTTLTGSSDFDTSVFYVDGDFEIPSGKILTITGNVQLRVKGFLHLSGTGKINGKGGGMAAGVAGFGNTRGEGGMVYVNNSGKKADKITSIEAPLVAGSSAVVPEFKIENNAGLLVGLPNDLRGSGGGKGGGLYTGITLALDGPTGAAGGAGLLIICRGMQVDTSAQIDLSGNNATLSATQIIDLWGVRDPYCGAGAGGHPGGMLVLLDGDGLTAPAPSLSSNNFIAQCGESAPQPGMRLTEVSINSKDMDGSPDRCSYYTNYTDENGVVQRVGGTSGLFLTEACKRIQFVKRSKLPQPVYLLSTTPGALVFQQATAPTNADCQTMAKRDLKLGDMWYDSDDGFKPYRYSGSAWAVVQDASIATAQALAQTAYNNAQTALANAATAQTTADGAIKTFYQTGAPSSGMAEGDIWFDTDDGNKIYTYRSGSWTVTQDSQIAAAINSAQTAQTTADGKAFVHYQASAPTGKTASDNGDIWIDTDDNNKMYVYSHPSWVLAQDWFSASQTANWNTVAGAPSGSGVNLIPIKYRRSLRATLPAIQVGSGSVARETSNTFFGTGGAVKNTATATNAYSMFGTSITDYNIPITPNKKWIFSVYVYPSVTGNVQLHIRTSASGAYITSANLAVTANVWQRVSAILDASADASPRCLARIDNELGAGNTCIYDGLMLEEYLGSGTTPSPYDGGSTPTDDVDFPELWDRRTSFFMNTAGRAASQFFLRGVNLSNNQNSRSGGTAITSADAGTTATITVNAWSITTGSGVLNYNSGTITGLTFSATYFIYCSDPNMAGGAVTYLASTTYTVPSSNEDYVFVGKHTCCADGGSGGGGGGGGDYCVAIDSYLPNDKRADEIEIGVGLRVLNDDYSDHVGYDCTAYSVGTNDCVRLISASGIALVCSINTPITQPDGSTIRADESIGAQIAALDHGEFYWSTVVSIEHVGQRVVAKISCDARTYAAGEFPDRFLFTHNIKP